jgi:hypothetical protein
VGLTEKLSVLLPPFILEDGSRIQLPKRYHGQSLKEQFYTLLGSALLQIFSSALPIQTCAIYSLCTGICVIILFNVYNSNSTIKLQHLRKNSYFSIMAS